jgi:hypothetical protein
MGYPDPSADQFVFKFFTEDPLQPGWPFQLGYGDGTRAPKDLSPLNFAREATGMSSSPSAVHDGGTVYAYWANLDAPITFEAGKRYWLAITNKTPTWAYPSQPNAKWGWLGSSSGTHWYRLGHCPMCAQEWNASDTSNLAFRLETAAVPEPSGISMLLCGLISIGGLARRVKKM